MEDADSLVDAERWIDLAHLTVDRRLKCLLGDPLPVRERTRWLALSRDQRALAMLRMKAIVRWEAGRGTNDPAAAAKAAGLTTNHFYEMAKTWRGARSLAAIEVLASAPRTRSSEYEEALKAHVRTAFDELAVDGKMVVKQVADRLAALAAADLPKTPSFATLRRKVEEEKRRRERRSLPGAHLQFDCCAFTMASLDQPVRAVLAVIDRRTQLVLGAALGDPRTARQGYGLAAADALRRITTGSLTDVAWAEALVQSEMAVGLDDGLLHMGVEAATAGLAAVQPATRPGRYLRKAAGDRMGRVLFLGADQLAMAPRDVRPEEEADDAARLQVEVEIHNAAILPDLEHDPVCRPPSGLVAMLEFVARGG